MFVISRLRLGKQMEELFVKYL